MLLKSIDLFGFKSFADKTKIELSEGITALLGPNGCGKSNVVDAVKWVLGEQSIRSLRADRMEDVIFSGTESRKALNVAEVTLTLLNEGRDLPLDSPEIAIRRRLYRSGESEYFINATAVRLKEVRELFFDTGLGKSAYSIMEQGKIDQILSTRPDERRLIFEEAAGITRFRARGLDAERKLEKTEENMRQVEGILEEVRRSYESLKRQAEKTDAYRRLREEIFQAELSVHLLRLREYTEERNGLEEKLADKTRRRDEVKSAIDGLNESMEQNIDQVNAMETRLVDNQKKLYRIELEKGHKDSQVRILRERTGELERKIAADEERQRVILRKLEGLNEERTAKAKSREELTRRIQEVEENIGSFERDIQQFASRVRANETQIVRMAQEVTRWEAELEELRVSLREIIDHIVAELDRKLRESGYSVQGRKEAEESIRYHLNSLRIHLEGKARIVQDRLMVQGPKGMQDLSVPQDPGSWTASLTQALQESLAMVDELENLFEGYRRFTPAFLEDFLAPQGIITRKRDIDQQITERLGSIALRREESEKLRTENRSLAARIEEYRRTLEELRVGRARMQAQGIALEGEIARLEREVRESEAALEAAGREAEETRLRLGEIGSRIGRLEEEKQALEQEEGTIKVELSRLEGDIALRNQNLQDKEKNLKSRTGQLAQLHSDLEKLQVRLAESNTEIRSIYRNFNEQHARDLTEFESNMFQIEKGLKELRGELAELREKAKGLGQINLMAPEEFAEVSERYNFLLGQLEDLKKARTDLNRVTEEIRSESAELFMETYNMVRKNFHSVFRRLFGGGRAELRLLEPENVLESGVEILAQPPGKRLESISLLSGGERSMTAVALLFSIYMVRPSPFCLLDEIDAALDEANIGRFVTLLKEFSSSSQFVIVTHNKKTVASAETLLGITMEESGVSKLIAIRLDNRSPERTYA